MKLCCFRVHIFFSVFYSHLMFLQRDKFSKQSFCSKRNEMRELTVGKKLKIQLLSCEDFLLLSFLPK